MAVTATGNIWVFTNADESATPVSIDNPLVFDRVRWTGGTTAGHQVILKDADGNVVLALVADAANFDTETEAPIRTNGLIVDTIDSGTVYVYHKVD